MASDSIIEVPVNIEAEQAALLSCFLSETALYTLLEECSDLDFHHLSHRHVFNAIKYLSNKDIAIDKTTVSDQIKDKLFKEQFYKIFDRKDSSPSNIEDYCRILQEHTKLRLALEASYVIQREVRTPEKGADAIIEGAEDLLFKAIQRQEAKSFSKPSDIIEETYATIRSKIGSTKDSVIGLTTTIKKLDQITYGFERQTLNILAGRPSMGKTEYALQLSISNALKGYPIAFFSIEQPESELMERLIAHISEISLSKVKKGYLNKDEVNRLEMFYESIEKMPLYIDDTPNISITHLIAKSKRLKQKVPNLSMIIIDYIQLMEAPTTVNRNRNEEMTQISKALKILSRVLDLPIIALSQLSRKCEEREDKRPLLSDLRESGAIEQDADKVIFMYSDFPYISKKESNETEKYKGEIIVAKHRNGPIDFVSITNNKPIQKIYDRADLKPEHVGYGQAIQQEEDDLPF